MHLACRNLRMTPEISTDRQLSGIACRSFQVTPETPTDCEPLIIPSVHSDTPAARQAAAYISLPHFSSRTRHLHHDPFLLLEETYFIASDDPLLTPASITLPQTSPSRLSALHSSSTVNCALAEETEGCCSFYEACEHHYAQQLSLRLYHQASSGLFDYRAETQLV